jgi:transcriptional regulator with AAA-type ATPase domain
MDDLAERLGESPTIEVVRDKLRPLLDRQRAGQRLPPILLQGETGTGKGLVARLLHRQGARRRGPFVDVNCAAIPATLVEAELFGFERGAFTDAHRTKPGLFQAAHGGVLFLDEVALLPDAAQAKLLTAVEEHAVRRLGSTRPEPADVWLISATNADLLAAVGARRFRQDLYHRLAVLTLDLPPLRDRGGDILLLAERFLARACTEYGLPPKRLDPGAQARLLAYSWPGNVRELANVIERATLLADTPVVTADTLGPLEADGAGPASPEPPSGTTPSRDEAMRRHLLTALEQTGWNISHAAARLGVARNTVYTRLEKFGLRPELPRTTAPAPPHAEPAAAPPAADTGLEWERRSVTLLRADLRNAEGVDAWSQSSRAMDAIVAKVQSFGGRVEEVTPTGLVAAFGLDPSEDAPRRAAHAALAIQRAAHRARESANGIPAVTIGLHVAPLLTGVVGTRIEIDAAAKRAQWPVLEQLLHLGEAGETVASDAAAPFLERRFELARVDAGTDGQGLAYRLTGQERRGLGLWGAMTAFVGRQEELEVLRTRLAMAKSGGWTQGSRAVGGAAGRAGLVRAGARCPQGTAGEPVDA